MDVEPARRGDSFLSQRDCSSDDKTRIRAHQGHSVEVDLQLEPQAPPTLLYHGTVARFLSSIRAQGLLPGSRQYVHLSNDRQTATTVGRRRGQPVILTIRAERMQTAGHTFYLSRNGVWLTQQVPAEFIDFPDA